MHFFKYQGAGNDFVMLDNRLGDYDKISIKDIRSLCDRKFGIGADGLIVISNRDEYDFEMIYYNADGSSSFCGNGARCAVSFAQYLGIIDEKAHFLASDGEHNAVYRSGLVALQMADVREVVRSNEGLVLNTGSPHYILFKDSINEISVLEEGRKIRYSDEFIENGINVNFVEKIDDSRIRVRTYERGVEDETLSCGTGVTAAALVTVMMNKQPGDYTIHVKVEGGELLVKCKYLGEQSFSNIELIGPATKVFKGEIDA